MQPLARSRGNVQRFERLVDFRNGLFFDGQKFQTFLLVVRNNGGTIQHTIAADPNATPPFAPDRMPLYAEKILGRNWDGSFSNTPTVSASVDFVNGGGLLTGNTMRFIFNTAHQDITALIGFAQVIYYDGNSSRPRPIAWFGAGNNIKGATRTRLEIYYTIGISASSWTIDATRIPSGKKLITRVMAALV
jgi:hypothetical protein